MLTVSIDTVCRNVLQIVGGLSVPSRLGFREIIRGLGVRELMLAKLYGDRIMKSEGRCGATSE
jgi:hypothetical protein